MNTLLNDGLLLAVALIAGAALIALLFRPIVRWIAHNVGDWLAQIVIDAVQAVLDSLDVTVDATPSEVDDDALEELKRRLQALEDEIKGRSALP
jgi:hypothetical protein